MTNKHMKRCSTSLITSETPKQHHSETAPDTSEWLVSKRPQITDVGKDVEKREPLYMVGGNFKLAQPLWKRVWRLNQKKKKKKRQLKIKLSYDPTIPLLGIYLKKMKTFEKIYAPQSLQQHYL